MTQKEKIDWVYSNLEDEKSKLIFEARKQFALSNDEQYIDELVRNSTGELGTRWYPGKEKELVKVLKQRGLKIIIYGAGYYGKQVFDLCFSSGLQVEFFCDADKNKWGSQIQGITIISTDKLKEIVKDHLIVVSPKYAYKEIVDKLIKMGIKSENIYKYIDYICVVSKEQYFDDDIIQFEDGEIFIDGGCLNLDTSKIFASKMKACGCTFEKIYAFEPDGTNYQTCMDRSKCIGFGGLEMINAGLWSKNGLASFSSEGTGSSHIIFQGGGYIRTVTLDSAINDKVTFIKMDIEGAELEALKGARNTILKYKPKLAICIYHKDEDIWKIPYFIKNLVPEYRLYIRHYSNWILETVLYAVC